MTSLRVAAFTGGANVPSARFRVRQHLVGLRKLGVQMTEYASPLGSYPPQTRWLRPAWGVASLAARLPGIIASHGADLTLLQREFISSFATLEWLTRRPRVLDLDDAIWLLRGGAYFDRLAHAADAIICGNRHIAEHCERYGRPICVLPTAVDVERFVPAETAGLDSMIFGWSGTSGGFRYLYAIEEAIVEVLHRVPGSRFRVIADQAPSFRRVPTDRLEYVRWSPDVEVSAIQSLAVGLMPLDDSPWERGKCSFKMLTYMACSVPVVVSPVGMNAELLGAAQVGFGAATIDDWTQAIETLLRDRAAAARMGRNGRVLVEQRFSLDIITASLAAVLRSVAGCSPVSTRPTS